MTKQESNVAYLSEMRYDNDVKIVWTSVAESKEEKNYVLYRDCTALN